MQVNNIITRLLMLAVLLLLHCTLFAQGLTWSEDGNSYYTRNENTIIQVMLPGMEKNTVVNSADLMPPGRAEPIAMETFRFSADFRKVLIYTNSKRVWRQNTKGDYWVLDLQTRQLQQLGRSRPASSLMFAKLSPDGSKAAYVSERNIYVEDLASGIIKQLTDDKGTPKLINGTFDWVYEEEFFCRDGFRWAPDGKSIAYWQIDANQIGDFYMIDNTDSIYSRIIPVEYPKVGFPPSPARVGVVDIASANTVWMDIPGDPRQHYLIRMEYTPDGQEIVIQQLNRKQNVSKLMLCHPGTGEARTILEESDEAWVSTINEWSREVTGWDWIDGGRQFLWMSEKDGWRHLWLISRNGKKETLLSDGPYDVISLDAIDEKNGYAYFSASPANATQQYLWRVRLDGRGKPGMVSPQDMPGSHAYTISPGGKFARWRFSNYYTRPLSSWISLPDHQPLPGQPDLTKGFDPEAREASKVEFFKVTTEEGVEMDGWMMKPDSFDATKKYPAVFYVYGEPASTTVEDRWGSANFFLYQGDMAADGYLHISLDGRGTPAPKGRAWRKAIYRNIGRVNIRDQALGAKKLIEKGYIDPERVAVWGWSGGGSSTLNLMFQYPEIYKTGISIAPVTNSLFYDNIYTERYMGLPQENMEDYAGGAAVTHAHRLEGNLLLVHGTADDNVHFQNAEMLVNELVKHNKQFRYMAYPGRSHGLGEGEGTFQHLSTMCTGFLREHCPPGAK